MVSFPKLDSKILLSPMAGVTDVAFRTLAKRYGAGLTYTEFISSTAIVRENKKTKDLLVTDPSEQPVAVQLFGSDIDDVVKAAQIVEPHFDVIDVNCGCPAWKVIKTGAGSELLKKPKGIGEFINRLSSAVNVPVTLKIRTGIDDKHINAVDVAQIAQDNGASAIAVHGRTQQQGYKGVANWDLIKQVKQAVKIPVIGNGDVFTPEVAQQRLSESGVDFLLIARGAMGNPYVISQMNQFITTGSYDTKDTLEQYFELLEIMKQYKLPLQIQKTHAMSFTKGKEGGAKVRQQIMTAKTQSMLESVMRKART